MKTSCRVLALALLLLLPLAAHAGIEPPEGELPLYTNLTGYAATVLCQSLTVREHPSATAAPSGLPFEYGTSFYTTAHESGWRSVVQLRDGSQLGWVREEYILVDPAYYVTEGETPVYAYDGPASPRVALLDAGERLPIIHETDTGYVVSLRGAAGFVRKEPT